MEPGGVRKAEGRFGSRLKGLARLRPADRSGFPWWEILQFLGGRVWLVW